MTNPRSETTIGDNKARKNGTGVTLVVDLNKRGFTDDAIMKAGMKVNGILGDKQKPGPTSYFFWPGGTQGFANSNSGFARVLEEAKPGSTKNFPLARGFTPGFQFPYLVGTTPAPPAPPAPWDRCTSHPFAC
jgi:hypothetical protein